jgi:hypothetical protein
MSSPVIATLPSFKGQDSIVAHRDQTTDLLTQGATGIAEKGKDDRKL